MKAKKTCAFAGCLQRDIAHEADSLPSRDAGHATGQITGGRC